MKRSLYRKIYANHSIYVYIHIIYLQLPPTSMFRLRLENLFFQIKYWFSGIVSWWHVIDHQRYWSSVSVKAFQPQMAKINLGAALEENSGSAREVGCLSLRERKCLRKKIPQQLIKQSSESLNVDQNGVNRSISPRTMLSSPGAMSLAPLMAKNYLTSGNSERYLSWAHSICRSEKHDGHICCCCSCT